MITIEEFTVIVESYGTEPARWPVAYRGECERLLAVNVEAQDLLKQQLELENLLGQIAVPDFPGLESRILRQSLPPQPVSIFDYILQWLLPSGELGRRIWRPALAACLPLAFGILIGNFSSIGFVFEDDSFEYWDDELYMLSLSDYTEDVNFGVNFSENFIERDDRNDPGDQF